MKKILVVCAAMTLLCSLVHAQEAEDTGRGAGLSIIPRLDAGILHTGGETLFSFGNTSLYTLFEGNISENWSFSVANHWIASDWGCDNFQEGIVDPTVGLYSIYVPFYGDYGNNFLDWAYITYAPGSWEFSLGKMPLIVGGWEFDEYDFDVNPMTTSLFWNTFTVYQYGATVAWTTPDEAHTFTAQYAATQFNTNMAFGVKWNGEIGPWSTNYSVLMSKYARPFASVDAILPIISIGNRLTFEPFTVTVDFINRCGDPDYLTTDIFGHTLMGTVAYAPSESFDVSARAVWNRAYFDITDTYENFCTYSLQANWYPVENLRVQGCAGLMDGDIFATIGATYTLSFNLW